METWGIKIKYKISSSPEQPHFFFPSTPVCNYFPFPPLDFSFFIDFISASNMLVNCPNCRTQLLVPPAAGGFICCRTCWAVSQVAGTSSLPPPRPPYYSAHHPLPPPYGQMPASQPVGVLGRKRAVICGVLYRNSGRELKGSVNDAKCMEFLLRKQFKFPESSILMLTGNF